MHLKQLKLAGFKSFVDPLVIPFPGKLLAVLGPNGCGKSNIIDAVRWVMGESSAKNLRGESMADVIFNGSSGRKAVGQASVELVFDNSFGRLTGQYASYQEVAVKRLVTRDGDSAYFLNGTRCRRRDITDMFAGTGAGARGYSIIGQGTISRIVEARPEELRAFLEEAAGVSKYRDRRRETLSRMTQTRDNLTRVADIREELAKQLQRLERQAEAAKRYQMLKREEHDCRMTILALKWQALSDEQVIVEQDVIAARRSLEHHQSLLIASSNKAIQLREMIQTENQRYQTIQADAYHIATDIARLEETIAQAHRDKQRLLADEQQIKHDWQVLALQIAEEKDNRQKYESALIDTMSKQADTKAMLTAQQDEWQAVEQQQILWQAQWNDWQHVLTSILREEQTMQMDSNHLERLRQEAHTKLGAIESELQQINEELNALVDTQSRMSLPLLEEALKQEERHLETITLTITSNKEQLTHIEKELRNEQDRYHQLKTAQASLDAVIRAAIGQDKSLCSSDETIWSKNPLLIDVISVEPLWQRACEFVSGMNLGAIVVDTLDTSAIQMACSQGMALSMTMVNDTQNTLSSWPRLSDKIDGVIPSIGPDFDSIFAAATINEALSWLPLLSKQQSIITPECCWMGPGWLRMAGIESSQAIGLLARQQELNTLQHDCLLSASLTEQLIIRRDEGYSRLKENDRAQSETLARVQEASQKLRVGQTDSLNYERLNQQLQAKKAHLIDSYEHVYADLEDMSLRMDSLASSLQAVNSRQIQHRQKEQQLIMAKASWEALLVSTRERLESTRAISHQLQLQQTEEQLLIRQAIHHLARDEERLSALEERLETITNVLLLANQSNELLASLDNKLIQHREIEQTLEDCKEHIEQLNSDDRLLSDTIKAQEHLAKTVSEALQIHQLHLQSLTIRWHDVSQSLNDAGCQVMVLLAELSADITIARQENKLLSIVDKMKRLGAINLVAIDEFEQESERKQYLDEQYQDLMEAVTTLEQAIEKMDQDTKQRLQQTFNDVNQAFQQLFPRLFGGGRAMLELTCDNLLEAGIVVMAQPPGKRNSTIHLLSGGEKAMTAVALVFAIFQLNPSPFCMLDEVDAPLDDVNVGRFCALVKEMSQFVQFLFITHNKVTMELADHLIGVTMREPGVSRVVAVDVEQALAMTTA